MEDNERFTGGSGRITGGTTYGTEELRVIWTASLDSLVNGFQFLVVALLTVVDLLLLTAYKGGKEGSHVTWLE